MESITLPQFMGKIEEILKTKSKKKYYCLVDHTAIHKGMIDDVDINYAKAHKIPIYEMHRDGGGVVISNGDIEFAYYSLEYKVPIEIEKLIHFLVADKDLKVSVDNNDVLVDGKKVASFAYILDKNRGMICVIHISVNIDKELISHICLKKSVKEPACLSDYGITTEEIKYLLCN